MNCGLSLQKFAKARVAIKLLQLANRRSALDPTRKKIIHEGLLLTLHISDDGWSNLRGLTEKGIFAPVANGARLSEVLTPSRFITSGLQVGDDFGKRSSWPKK
jgi:hypothetical protein